LHDPFLIALGLGLVWDYLAFIITLHIVTKAEI